MPLLDETLTIQGIALDAQTVPPAASLSVERLWMSEEVTLLGGQTRTYSAENAAGWLITLAPGENFSVPLAVKQAVEAAYYSRQPITLAETLSDPSQAKTWAGLLTERPSFAEVPGTSRELYTYALKLKQEE